MRVIGFMRLYNGCLGLFNSSEGVFHSSGGVSEPSIAVQQPLRGVAEPQLWPKIIVGYSSITTSDYCETPRKDFF
jgi:hypothetical protein